MTAATLDPWLASGLAEPADSPIFEQVCAELGRPEVTG